MLMCTWWNLGICDVQASVEGSQLWPLLPEAPGTGLSAGVECPLSPCHSTILGPHVLWNLGPVQVAHSRLVASCSRTSGSSRGRSHSLALNYCFESVIFESRVLLRRRGWRETSASPCHRDKQDSGRENCGRTRGSPKFSESFLRSKSWTVCLLTTPPFTFGWDIEICFLFLILGYSCL